MFCIFDIAPVLLRREDCINSVVTVDVSSDALKLLRRDGIGFKESFIFMLCVCFLIFPVTGARVVCILRIAIDVYVSFLHRLSK